MPHDVLTATELAQAHQLSFWDAMIVRSAGMLGCSTVWTEDFNPGHRINGVTIDNPLAP